MKQKESIDSIVESITDSQLKKLRKSYKMETIKGAIAYKKIAKMDDIELDVFRLLQVAKYMKEKMKYDNGIELDLYGIKMIQEVYESIYAAKLRGAYCEPTNKV